jgi:hypothetical protein
VRHTHTWIMQKKLECDLLGPKCVFRFLKKKTEYIWTGERGRTFFSINKHGETTQTEQRISCASSYDWLRDSTPAVPDERHFDKNKFVCPFPLLGKEVMLLLVSSSIIHVFSGSCTKEFLLACLLQHSLQVLRTGIYGLNGSEGMEPEISWLTVKN